MLKMLPEREIIDYLREKLNPYLIYVFGSYAKDEARHDSDIDLAYLTDNEVDDYENFMIAQGLSSIVNRDVDLINLDKASTVFQVQISYPGKVLFCSDEQRRILFEMKALKMYAKLNEERQPILDRIKESGSVYEE